MKLDKYNELKGSLKTGDLLLFSGTGLFSWVIRLTTRSKYSHVAAVYVNKYGKIECYESTTLNENESGKKVKGVQINSLDWKLKNYWGRVWIRHLNQPLDWWHKKRLEEFGKKTLGLPYERNLIDLVLSAFGASRRSSKGKKLSFFCSELIVSALQWAGLIDPSVDASSFDPGDLSLEKDEEIPYSSRFRYGPEIPLF